MKLILRILVFVERLSDRLLGFHVWQCAWCRSYFNMGSQFGKEIPLRAKVDGHGICMACFKSQTGKEYKPEMEAVAR